MIGKTVNNVGPIGTAILSEKTNTVMSNRIVKKTILFTIIFSFLFIIEV